MQDEIWLKKAFIFQFNQTAQDIYDAAEQLILPPARNETSPADQDLSQRDSPLIQPLEDVEVEDFWGDDWNLKQLFIARNTHEKWSFWF